MILAVDVGGTKALLGLFERSGGKLRSLREESLPSQAFPSFEMLIERFLSQGREKVRACAVGVAGPVTDGKSQVVNLPWVVDSRRLARTLGLARVELLNDLEATARGVPELPPSKFVNLTPGLRPQPGNAALIAAGTGLGMALVPWEGERYVACASEGGHQSFAPRDDREIELLKFLRKRYGRVSIERVVSGPGIFAIYQFLIESGSSRESDFMTRRLADAKDPNAAITLAAMAGEDTAAERALALFVSLYGAAAGDLALVTKAVGGVYIGGGIAPRILPKLRSGEFIRSFRAKGRLTPLLERIPVRVIVEPRTALLGAAARAELALERGGSARTARPKATSKTPSKGPGTRTGTSVKSKTKRKSKREKIKSGKNKKVSKQSQQRRKKG